ncbi:MAG: hypothetical protein AAFO91_05970 [Bacteroidota bacterium]
MYYENSFLVLPDQRTVIGVDALDKRKLLMEDMTRQSPEVIGKFKYPIASVLYDQDTDSLFAADRSGHLTQYRKTATPRLFGLFKDAVSFAVSKDLGNLGIGETFSCARAFDLAVFGGSEGSVAVVNIPERRLYKSKTKVGVGRALTLEVCPCTDSEVYLSVGGQASDSFGRPGILELGSLYQSCSQFTKVGAQQADDSVLKEKDRIIASQKEEIEQLKKALLRNKTQTLGTAH